MFVFADLDWQTKVMSNDPLPVASVPFETLSSGSEFQFRVIALNHLGIGHPSEATEFYEVEGISSSSIFSSTLTSSGLLLF